MKLLQITGSSWILFFANVRFWWPWKHQWNLWISNVFIEDQKGTSRSSRSHMFFKILKYVLKNSAILTGKHLCWSQLFSCEYCKIFMNSFFVTPPVAASWTSERKGLNQNHIYCHLFQTMLMSVWKKCWKCWMIRISPHNWIYLMRIYLTQFFLALCAIIDFLFWKV